MGPFVIVFSSLHRYQDTLLAVHEYAQKEAIPYRHVLLDSWWYTKGAVGGLKEWDATPSTFPDGLKSFADKTGWKFQMHNRMYATFRLNFYHFDRFQLDPRGHTQMRGAAFPCPRLKSADMVLI